MPKPKIPVPKFKYDVLLTLTFHMKTETPLDARLRAFNAMKYVEKHNKLNYQIISVTEPQDENKNI